LRPLLLVDPSICSKGAENAGGQWRIDAFEKIRQIEYPCGSSR
jgi:hypothetical protein